MAGALRENNRCTSVDVSYNSLSNQGAIFMLGIFIDSFGKHESTTVKSLQRRDRQSGVFRYVSVHIFDIFEGSRTVFVVYIQISKS